MLAKQTDERGHDRHPPNGCRGLRRDANAVSAELFSNADQAGLEIGIGPGEAEQLALTQPGEDRRGEDGPVEHRSGVEETADLFPVEDAHLGALDARPFAALEPRQRVGRDRAPPGRVPEHATRRCKHAADRPAGVACRFQERNGDQSRRRRPSLRRLHRGLHGPRFSGIPGTSDRRNRAVFARPGRRIRDSNRRPLEYEPRDQLRDLWKCRTDVPNGRFPFLFQIFCTLPALKHQ